MLKVSVDKKIRAVEFSTALVLFITYSPSLMGLGESYLTTIFCAAFPIFTM